MVEAVGQGEALIEVALGQWVRGCDPAVLAPQVAELDRATYLPLVDLSMPALREMSEPQFERFRRDVRERLSGRGDRS
jgi:hypothetical protein